MSNKWNLSHPELNRRLQREWYYGNRRKKKQVRKPEYIDPVKVHARSLLAAAVRRHKISRPDFCSRCGVICKPEGHHEDYAQPLIVVWLCRMCHGITRRLEAALKADQQPPHKSVSLDLEDFQ